MKGRKRNLEPLAHPPPLPRPERKKIVWPFLLREELYGYIRELAAVRGITLSAAVSVLLEAGIDLASFPPLPPGASIKLQGSGTSRPTRYFVPLEIAERVQDIQERGYSNAYIMTTIIEKGLEVVRRNSKGSPDLRSGTLEEPRLSIDAAEGGEGTDVPGEPAGGSGAV